MKKIILSLLVISSFNIIAQEKKSGLLYGSFESNSQWYINDEINGREIKHPEDPFRSNNYLQLNYNYNKWTAGLQLESYAPNALLNYNPKYDETNVGTYFLNYKSNKIDATAGYFYEQFGSGLILRTWEDRALGINNALRGGRIKYSPIDDLTFIALYGKQRTGFDVANSDIFGFNTEFNASSLLNFEASDLSLGLSYVGRDEKTDVEKPKFESLTNAFSGRLNFSHNSFYASTEYAYKSEEPVIVNNSIDNNFIKPGNAILVNFGYSQKNLGIDATLRRMENMSFYSEREPELYIDNNFSGGSTSYNFNDKIINYLPALTKQHHYNLANIYVYQVQKIDIPDPAIGKIGEIGGQFDIFYNFEKESALGGKYGTKVTVNIANWYNLKGNYTYFPPSYNTEFFGSGKKYFSDYNIEITKKINDKLQGNFVYVNQYVNQKFLQGGSLVKTNIIAADATYKINKTQSVRLQGEHMWADADKKNWAGATLEFYYNPKLSFYVWDMYNYGNNKVGEGKVHYYNLGGSYRKGASRVALNYGRQRGGLVCVGGVCRFVPESKGLSISLSTSF
jgi:hypothetical protein